VMWELVRVGIFVHFLAPLQVACEVATRHGRSGCGHRSGQAYFCEGYVLDSACAFTKNLKKPISAECAVACARAGSPLVILSDEGTVYWPIAETTPSSGQNESGSISMLAVSVGA
jgi:hypothetical protein